MRPFALALASFSTPDGLYEFDAVVLVDRLHASGLRSLSPESFVATRLKDSPSPSQLPYVRFPHQGNSLQDLTSRVMQQIAACAPRFSSAKGPRTSTGSILARYQLLTAALISGLLLTFFVHIPIVHFGPPLHVNAPKVYSTDEKST
ncbi:hypothetical protein EDB83DRAFT_2381831, partial [Lactarius deliciosus]